MIVIGGRTNQVGESVPMEVYDTESSEWFKFPAIQRFRHACWSMSSKLYVHGGFEPKTPNIPTDLISVIDCCKLFQNVPNLLPKFIVDDKFVNVPIDPNNDNSNDSNDNNCIMIENTSRALTPNIKDINCEVKMSESCFVINIDDERDKLKKVSIKMLQEESKRIGENYNNQIYEKTN